MASLISMVTHLRACASFIGNLPSLFTYFFLKRGRDLRDQIKKLSGSHVLDGMYQLDAFTTIASSLPHTPSPAKTNRP